MRRLNSVLRMGSWSEKKEKARGVHRWVKVGEGRREGQRARGKGRALEGRGA